MMKLCALSNRTKDSCGIKNYAKLVTSVIHTHSAQPSHQDSAGSCTHSGLKNWLKERTKPKANVQYYHFQEQIVE